MSRYAENPLQFCTLYESSLVRVRNFHCRACRSGPATEEYSSSNDLVLMRGGAFSKHVGRRSVTVDVNQAVFFSKESTYRVSHPTDGGDRGTVLTPSPRVLNDIIRELDPSVDDHPERPFPFLVGPCDTAAFSMHTALVRRLEVASLQPLDPLWVDVAALQLVAKVLEATFARQGLPRKRRRTGTDAAHAELAEAVKVLLASRLSERITLDHVACAVSASPFHLSRVFQQYTGVPIHRYLNRLRLRTAFERLEGGAKDLTVLALEFGFSSHSHFTDAFRREFGHCPSLVRNRVRP